MAALTRLLMNPFSGGRLRLPMIVRQILRAGYESLPLVMLISVLLGMIVAFQSAYQLTKLGALNLVANLVAVSVTRELAPLMTAIIISGRYGSAVSAELGMMKVSQEVDALTVMGIDPVSFLVIPRLVAFSVALPCLTIFADVAGILGGLTVSVLGLGIGSNAYLSHTLDALQGKDVVVGLVKAFVFAWIIGLVACQVGLATRGGPEEVGRATTTAVVRSIVLVIGADLFVTALFYVEG
ncbi:MAG: MlaE family ABC transporter permease [Candidatus Polarisedimenticolia bacterium]